MGSYGLQSFNKIMIVENSITAVENNIIGLRLSPKTLDIKPAIELKIIVINIIINVIDAADEELIL